MGALLRRDRRAVRTRHRSPSRPVSLAAAIGPCLPGRQQKLVAGQSADASPARAIQRQKGLPESAARKTTCGYLVSVVAPRRQVRRGQKLGSTVCPFACPPSANKWVDGSIFARFLEFRKVKSSCFCFGQSAPKPLCGSAYLLARRVGRTFFLTFFNVEVVSFEREN